MRFIVSFVVAFTIVNTAAHAEPTPIILDTDIGSDIDDALALALVVASPELDLQAVTTCGGAADDRAWLVCRFLTQVGIKTTPVAIGKAGANNDGLDWQIQYRRHPAAIFNRTLKPVKESAVELLYRKLKENPGKITIVCVGPLTNIAQLLEEHPDAKPWIKRLVIMGGSITVGYDGKKQPEPEWNIKTDIAAAKKVFAAGVPITLAPLDVTGHLQLTKDQRERLFAAHTPLTWQVKNLYELWDKETPILFDPVAVVLAFEEKFCKFTEGNVQIDDKGMTTVAPGKANAKVAMSIDGDAFIKWYVERVRSHGKEVLPGPFKNKSKLIEQTGFPARVHTFEDYDTDIEKRWWMCGKAETKDVPPGGKVAHRAQRAVLTQDFDDRQGDMKAMYRAVIFNPVPGPPMGKNTRLSFRYKIHGTDTMKIALYSLTNGYHRYLSLDGLKQNEWLHGTVDMTQMRRPDGSGGPLSENERIDDIQFYIDPRAELLIDDIILYDAAVEGEKRPFPKRILYTGWFDTGKQGKEWPGEFEIVDHEKKGTWKYAKSLNLKEVGRQGIFTDIRGERAIDADCEMTFRYRLFGTNQIVVTLVNSNVKEGSGPNIVMQTELKDLKKNDWNEATVRFPRPANLKKDQKVNGIVFMIESGAELNLDDVLFYVPGKTP